MRTIILKFLNLTHNHPFIPNNNRSESPIAEWTFPEQLSADITKDLLALKWDKSLESMRSFMDESKKIVASHLAGEQQLRRMISDLHNATSATSVVVLKNAPIDPTIPPTPTDGSKTLGKETFVAESMLLSLGEIPSSKVVGYWAEKEYSNPWVHEGFPRQGVGSALTAAHELSFHQDMSYQDHIPDILGLYCLREGHDKEVTTTIVDVREITSQLPDDVEQVLRQPRFQIRGGDWVDPNTFNAEDYPGRAILEGFSLHLPVNWENMVGLDDEATAALELLQEAILAADPHRVHFVEGTLVFFNNQRVIHGRSPYTDLRFDGNDRVLNRAYFRGELTQEEERTRMI